MAAQAPSMSTMLPLARTRPNRSIPGAGAKVTKRISLLLAGDRGTERADRRAGDLDPVAGSDLDRRIHLVAGPRLRDRGAKRDHVARLEHGPRPGLRRVGDAMREIGDGETLFHRAVEAQSDLGRSIELTGRSDPDRRAERRQPAMVLRAKIVARLPFALEHVAVGDLGHQGEADDAARRFAGRDTRRRFAEHG